MRPSRTAMKTRADSGGARAKRAWGSKLCKGREQLGNQVTRLFTDDTVLGML